MLWSFFFFKQKTAYEMRIIDWSSDVCSSDLSAADCFAAGVEKFVGQVDDGGDLGVAQTHVLGQHRHAGQLVGPVRGLEPGQLEDQAVRSEERRVGNEWVSPGSTWG